MTFPFQCVCIVHASFFLSLSFVILKIRTRRHLGLALVRLPLQDVSMLSQIIERETPQASAPAASSNDNEQGDASDARLGVLAKPAMKRETQVL